MHRGTLKLWRKRDWPGFSVECEEKGHGIGKEAKESIDIWGGGRGMRHYRERET